MNNSPGISNLTSLKLNSFFLPLHPNLLLLLLQPPTPNLFLPQTPLSKSMASLTTLVKPETIVIHESILSLICHMLSNSVLAHLYCYNKIP
jgi:hypothetical protein